MAEMPRWESDGTDAVRHLLKICPKTYQEAVDGVVAYFQSFGITITDTTTEVSK